MSQPTPTPTPSAPFPTPTSPLPLPNSALPQPKPRPGRPRTLDAVKQHRITTLLFCGCTLEQAAYDVGCATSTIRREARRNAEFHEELNKILLDSEIFAINAVRSAARTHWRAGRFLLEHMAAKRKLEQTRRELTPSQLRKFDAAIAVVLESEITDADQRQRISTQLNQVLRDINRKQHRRSLARKRAAATRKSSAAQSIRNPQSEIPNAKQ